MRLRIQANGPTSGHVSIVDAETGDPLQGVKSVTFKAGTDEGGAPTWNEATLTLEGAELDAEAVYVPEVAVEAPKHWNGVPWGKSRGGDLPAPGADLEGSETRATPAACAAPEWYSLLQDRHAQAIAAWGETPTTLHVTVKDLGRLLGEDCGPNACSRVAEGGWVCQAELDHEEDLEVVRRQSVLLAEARDRVAELEGIATGKQERLTAACDRVAELQREVDHWKANHDEQLRRKYRAQGLLAASLAREAALVKRGL